MITRKPPTIWKKISDKTIEIFKKIYKYLIVIALLILAGYLLTHLPYFNITKLNITNSEGKPLSYVTNDYVISKFNDEKDRNYFLYNIDTLETAIKKDNSYVEEVIVSKAFPNQLDINIKERVPKLVLNNQNKCMLLSETGYTLDIQDQVAGSCKLVYSYPGLILVNNPDFLGDFKVNTQSSFYIVNEIASVVTVYNYYGLDILSCDIKANVMTCVTQKGINVVFSTEQDIKEQLIRSIAILEQLNKQMGDIKGIDVRYKRPVIQEK